MDETACQHNSVYDLLNKQPETRIGRISKSISAYNASPEEAKQFDVAIGSAMILADDIGYAVSSGYPISYELCRKLPFVLQDLHDLRVE